METTNQSTIYFILITSLQEVAAGTGPGYLYACHHACRTLSSDSMNKHIVVIVIVIILSVDSPVIGCHGYLDLIIAQGFSAVVKTSTGTVPEAV